MLMRDFTLDSYRNLLLALQKTGTAFQTIEEYTLDPQPMITILRHDVDSWPSNALEMALVENNHGIKATYYFRQSPLSYNKKIIEKIVSLGHEIGYHYEDLSSNNGNFDKAIASFLVYNIFPRNGSNSPLNISFFYTLLNF